MSKQTVLVIDDERDIRELLTITLGRMELVVDTGGNVSRGAERASRIALFDLCFTDMKLPDGSGQEIIELIAARYPETPVAMITAYGNVGRGVTALKAGAFDFVSKPVDIHLLRRLVHTAMRLAEETQVRAAERRRSRRRSPDRRFAGDDRELRLTIAKLARNQAPVYISGESGVGKELVARLIHEHGSARHRPFVPVNCGAIPSELMESEFFGHRKGSFTGAHADKEGLFQAAQGGTLFLDEVAELPLHMQVKLLRAIQEKAVRRSAAVTKFPVDVRILSATHKNLATLVESGLFRQDLYYRINVIELRVPPLRDRRETCQTGGRGFWNGSASESGAPAAKLTPEALASLLKYQFPETCANSKTSSRERSRSCENNVIGRTICASSPASPSRKKRQKTSATLAVTPAVSTATSAIGTRSDHEGAARNAIQQDRRGQAAGHHLPRRCATS